MSFGCLRMISFSGVDAAELDQHAGEALGVGDGVLQAGTLGPSGVRADHEREPLDRRGRLGTDGARHGGKRQRQADVRRDAAGGDPGRQGRELHGLTSFCRENVDCVSSPGIASAAGGDRRSRAADRRAASRIGATSNALSPVMK